MSLPRRLCAIAVQEGRRLHRESLARMLGGLGLLLVLLSLGLSTVREIQISERQAAYAERADSDWQNQPDRHPHRVVHAGDFVFKAPGVLSRIDWGIEPQVGRSVFLEGHRQNTANFSDVALSGGLLRLGDLSPSIVVQHWLPLLMLLAGVASVAAERQNGTLLISLIGGARGGELLAGKALALWAFGLLMATPLVLMLLWVALSQPELAGRAAGLGFGFAAGLALAAIGTVLVSAFARTVMVALLVGVVAWFTLVAVAPRAVAAVVELAHPAPSQADIEQRIQASLAVVGDPHDPDSSHFAAFRERVLAEHGVDSFDELPVNFGGLVMLEGERLTSAVVSIEIKRQRDAWEAQSRLVGQLGWLLPPLALRDAAQAFAGTDFAHHRDFLDQVERRRFAMVQALNALHAHEIAALNDRAQRLDAAHWAEIPRTPIVLSSLSETSSRWPQALVQISIGWLLALVALAWTGRRLDRHA